MFRSRASLERERMLASSRPRHRRNPHGDLDRSARTARGRPCRRGYIAGRGRSLGPPPARGSSQRASLSRDRGPGRKSSRAAPELRHPYRSVADRYWPSRTKWPGSRGASSPQPSGSAHSLCHGLRRPEGKAQPFCRRSDGFNLQAVRPGSPGVYGFARCSTPERAKSDEKTPSGRPKISKIPAFVLAPRKYSC